MIRTNGFRVIAVGSWGEKISNFFFDSLCGFVRYLSYPESCGWVKLVCGGAGQFNKGKRTTYVCAAPQGVMGASTVTNVDPCDMLNNFCFHVYAQK